MLKLIKNFIVFLTLIIYIYIMLIPRGRFVFDMTYLKIILIITPLCLLLFSFGLIDNKKETYKNNINLYIFLYFILLISITLFIGRPNIDFSYENLIYINTDYLIPFNSITKYLFNRATLKVKLYNLLGNAILLVPLSFLLMIKNKKYNKLINQTKILLPIITSIEFFQLYTNTGIFDVDDIILNFFGAMFFVILITRFNFIDKVREFFYQDFNLNMGIKYCFFSFSLMVSIIFINLIFS